MSDLMNEERNEKIRKQWLERIESNEKVFANQLKKENLPFEKFLEIEKLQKEGQELKKSIEDGHIPDEPPVMGYKPVDGKLVPLTEEEADELEVDIKEMFESGDITIDPSDLDDDDFIDEEKPQPMPEIQKQEEGGKKLIGKIWDFFFKPTTKKIDEKYINRFMYVFLGLLVLCGIIFGTEPTINAFFSVIGLILIFSIVFGPVVQLLTRPSVKEKTEDDLYGKGWEARQKK